MKRPCGGGFLRGDSERIEQGRGDPETRIELIYARSALPPVHTRDINLNRRKT